MTALLLPRILWSSPDEQSESDCACSDSGHASVAPTFTHTESIWRAAHGLYRVPLPAEHEVAFNSRGAGRIVVLNRPARHILDAFERPQALKSGTAHQMAALDLLEPVNSPIRANRSQPRTLTAWVHVTNACNLRCTYCYLGKSDKAMDEATGRAAVDAVFRSAAQHGFDAVKLKYAGGEATLNFRLVQQLHAHATARAQECGMRLHEVVLSNGVALTGAVLDFIRERNMRLMISLDGLGRAHDTQRIFANGRGSAQLVARGIHRALARGVRPHLSITVTGHNAETLADTVAFALDHDLLFNLNFYRDNDFAASQGALAAEDARLIAGVRAAFKVIEERLPRHNLIAALLDRANLSTPHERACGAGHDYMVIDHNGRVARCQMEIERTIADVMVEDPLTFIRAGDIGFRNVSVDEKEGCRSCAWRQWCAGGCPLLTYRVTGRSDVQSPYCNVYRALFPDVVRLEGLRLLKWEACAA